MVAATLASYGCRAASDDKGNLANENHICLHETIQAQSKDKELTLEVACSLEEKQKGLMWRNALEENSGMIFVFDEEKRYAFWMKNTNIPLNAAYVNSKNIIVDIVELEPHNTSSVAPKEKALYVIETNKGWFEKNSISIGDTITFNLPALQQ